MTTIGQDETAQAMAERDPLPQQVTYHVWTDDEPAAGLQGERAEVTMFVAEPNDYVRATLAETFAKMWCAQPRHVHVMPEEPPERTPETVLRAMLRAYEKAALDIDTAYFRTGADTAEEEDLYERSKRADRILADLRDATAAAIVGKNYAAILKARGFFDDYQQRLSGKRDLSAPPMEDP